MKVNVEGLAHILKEDADKTMFRAQIYLKNIDFQACEYKHNEKE